MLLMQFFIQLKWHELGNEASSIYVWLECNTISVLDSALFSSQTVEFCQLIVTLTFDHYT